MSWIKQNIRMVTGVALALVLGLGGGYGLRAATVKAPASPSPEPVDSAQPVGQIGQVSILPTTQVEIRYTFLLCGHELEEVEIDGSLTGCTLNEVYTRLPDARVVRLDAERAIIERELECYCPKHYVLYLNGEDALCVSHTDETDLGEENVQTLNYDCSALPFDVISELEMGLVFDGLEQINAYLEDVES
ncbi:hypothetical protein LJC42_02790 [Eubacteriales bacterium OttesenSCG-928-K08]|nr:hypothetical protein [Eubacteriales bacterium OttesenSCG-928-K08]